uniref:Uncharacterized protein n=1 Tax=Anguilla anguilla TaxID=7936 RepID=A0A0E9PMB9_ANGAN
MKDSRVLRKAHTASAVKVKMFPVNLVISRR